MDTNKYHTIVRRIRYTERGLSQRILEIVKRTGSGGAGGLSMQQVHISARRMENKPTPIKSSTIKTITKVIVGESPAADRESIRSDAVSRDSPPKTSAHGRMMSVIVSLL
jgi:hypothetical protein